MKLAEPTKLAGNRGCGAHIIPHPERVIKILYPAVFIVDNMPVFGCVGTVQANCANFR
jgi:hypothetical protein